MSKRPLEPSGVENVPPKRSSPAAPSKGASIDTSGPCFLKLLSECGVVVPSASAAAAVALASAPPSPYTISVNPNNLRASVATLLKELQKNRSIDLDKVVLEDMQSVLGDQTTLHGMVRG